MNERLILPGRKQYGDKVLPIEQMLDKAGLANMYQFKLLATFFLVFTCASFVQMGFPIIFQPAHFICPAGATDCSQAALCNTQYQLDPAFKSVAFSFDLVCSRKNVLQNCFFAFLIGGIIGSFYYGENIERNGRRHAVLESMIMMIAGLTVSVLSGSAVLFSFGVFFFSAGFRGFYNASMLSLCEVANQIFRSETPMLLSIGWAVGQITIALICIWITSWRIIFLITIVPLTFLLYFAHIHVKQSPRFLVTKQKFSEAKKILCQIALINGKPWHEDYELVEQKQYNKKLQGYRKLEVNIRNLEHYSYASLIKYDTVRVRVIIVGVIWSIVSLSYFSSANSQINRQKSVQFNIALAGVVEIISYMVSMLTSLNSPRVPFIRRLLLAAAFVHCLYFFILPIDYTGFARVAAMTLDVSVRIIVAVANSFLAIYSIELFPTTVRHFTLGILGFITKLMYFISYSFTGFWSARYIHPNFVIGALFVGSFFITDKLRETHKQPLKDRLQEDDEGFLKVHTEVNAF